MSAPDPASPRNATAQPPRPTANLPAHPVDAFADRHMGKSSAELEHMLDTLSVESLDQLIDETTPEQIRMTGELDIPPARSEREVLEELRSLADQNQVHRSYIGLGYSGTITPPVILRSIFENPGWYTQYTPYQAEISQGRLEALFNFQTMVRDLTGLPIANASLLDEATAAAEAMTLCRRMQERRTEAVRFLVAEDCHPQTIDVVRTRAEPLGIEVRVEAPHRFEFGAEVFGALLQYPASDGALYDLAPLAERARAAGAMVVVASDLLALTLLKPPGELGADVVVGNSQRFGVPLFYGGPHAAFIATREDCLRKLPGRIIGLTKDNAGHPALRMALQTREQHIRRDRATSNICTAQVLLAVAASMYAVYHGPERLRLIAERVHRQACRLAEALRELGHTIRHAGFFDTLRVGPAPGERSAILARCERQRINLRVHDDGDLGVALDETVTALDLEDLRACFGGKSGGDSGSDPEPAAFELPGNLLRTSAFLEHPVFHRFQTEHEFLRYVKRLESRDLSLTTSMISLGSCTMKLNAAAQMIPVTWPGFKDIHPFAPPEQTPGYARLIEQLEGWLCQITGFEACSMQPNAGSQGEYTGLLTIRAYHHSRGEAHRNVCLIPVSAHGTNPASAVLAGLRVVVVACDDHGNIDLADLREKARRHERNLAALMVTYPSTHGVFETSIREICDAVHQHGGQVYLDGANLNAMVGLSRPGEIGADVCHLNLHKTFAIPHGGGGPGMGPICTAAHLSPFLPGHPLAHVGGKQAISAVSAAPYGSPGVLPITWAYIALLGAEGLKQATRYAILNANYVARRLDPHFPVLYRGARGRVAHECIVDLRELSHRSGIEIDDVAKRLMDYGFHAPTMSFPVAGTLMIEPTESESLEELDRFCDALIAIRGEIGEVEAGRVEASRSVLKGAPHTALAVLVEEWDRPYTREQAAFPSARTREHKFWPYVGRVDNVLGDRSPCCAWTKEAGGSL